MRLLEQSEERIAPESAVSDVQVDIFQPLIHSVPVEERQDPQPMVSAKLVAEWAVVVTARLVAAADSRKE